MFPLRFLIPNSFTAASLLLGFASILCSARGDFTLAAWMIIWGVLLDKLDGTAARLCNASSDFGVQFDSFADFVIFGSAPAALYYFLMSEHGNQGIPLSFTASGLYVLLTGTRLARFNISEPPCGDRLFFGLPTTLSGAILAASFLTVDKYKLLSYEQVGALSPTFLIIMAVLMVSNLILPKLKLRENKLLNLFQITNVAACYLVAPFKIYPEYLLAAGLTYFFVGIIWGVIKGRIEVQLALNT